MFSHQFILIEKYNNAKTLGFQIQTFIYFSVNLTLKCT